MKKNLIWVGLLVFTFFITTPASAQAVRGVTDTEILIGQWGPQTGPAAPWGAVARGTDLLVKVINEEGGIHGRKIKYFLRDDSYQPAKTKAIAKEFAEQIGVFGVVSGVGVATGMTARDYLMENKVIWVGPASGVYEWIHPIQKYLFAVYPLYDDEAFYIADYLYTKLGHKKIAMFHQNDDYGKQGLMGVQRYLLKQKLNLVEKVSAEVTDRDLSTHALKLKNSGAEAVIMWTNPQGAALLLTETAKIGFKPQWATSNSLSDAPLMNQITRGLWTQSGMITSFFGELPDSNHPLMVKYREAQKKFTPQERWGVFYYAGIIFSEPFFEGLRRAGRNLTPDTFVKAMETMKDFQGIGPPVTYAGKKDRQGGNHVFLGKVKPDGSTQKLTDWIRITK
jgi:ABC-type branched-subunit amino acid transport system substrate-binding protein